MIFFLLSLSLSHTLSVAGTLAKSAASCWNKWRNKKKPSEFNDVNIVFIHLQLCRIAHQNQEPSESDGGGGEASEKRNE